METPPALRSHIAEYLDCDLDWQSPQIGLLEPLAMLGVFVSEHEIRQLFEIVANYEGSATWLRAL